MYMVLSCDFHVKVLNIGRDMIFGTFNLTPQRNLALLSKFYSKIRELAAWLCRLEE